MTCYSANICLHQFTLSKIILRKVTPDPWNYVALNLLSSSEFFVSNEAGNLRPGQTGTGATRVEETSNSLREHGEWKSIFQRAWALEAKQEREYVDESLNSLWTHMRVEESAYIRVSGQNKNDSWWEFRLFETHESRWERVSVHVNESPRETMTAHRGSCSCPSLVWALY